MPHKSLEDFEGMIMQIVINFAEHHVEFEKEFRISMIWIKSLIGPEN